MVEGEATVKRKRRRRYRKRLYNNESQYHAHHSVPVDTDVKENKMIETVQAVTCRTEGNGDEASSMEVTDICSSSSVDEGLISNIFFGTSTGDMVSAGGKISVDGEMVRSERKSVLAEETVDAGIKEMHVEKDKCVETIKSSVKNTVLRSHPQKRRYFDLPNGNWARCLDYGENNPAAANCMLQRRGKAFFLSRNNRHIGKHCLQGQFCFVCRGTFRQAHDCPKKQEENHNICLRCGDSGHDMFSCMSNYSADDLKKIRCYVCKDFGHLSCVKLPDTSPTEASCYNCGQSGHFGSDCSKCSKVVQGSKSPALCYRCREEGHFARSCTLPRKHARKVRAEVISPGSRSSLPKHEPQSDANN
ncbi:uncharacterized protein LOC120177776 isoform X3 [Hibiscus syriacus]|uniref:uncharacterized protein LOC120177776 isoform X3 n=1 Tax=Hibiscus syriacus TaxID=106335 RepID=UPI0019218CF1|nr:uncharacterized protein LOC120177776 isoform X3 [Hibiscus syriacus]